MANAALNRSRNSTQSLSIGIVTGGKVRGISPTTLIAPSLPNMPPATHWLVAPRSIEPISRANNATTAPQASMATSGPGAGPQRSGQ